MRLTTSLLELDNLVVNIELTLGSIVQGVALSFLAENARNSLGLHESVTWLYLASGLLIILIFWSRSIIHTLTLIRWPLEFGHNFLYIACTLVETLLFTRLTNPVEWFELTAAYAVAVWILFVYDLRFLRLREADSGSAATRHLLSTIKGDQQLNIYLLVPGLFLYAIVSLTCLKLWPRSFVARQAHGWLALGQVITLLGYLYYVVRLFARFAPLVAERQEERRRLSEKS